jgi:hypothetical protein
MRRKNQWFSSFLNHKKKNNPDWLNIYFGRSCHHQELYLSWHQNPMNTIRMMIFPSILLNAGPVSDLHQLLTKIILNVHLYDSRRHDPPLRLNPHKQHHYSRQTNNVKKQLIINITHRISSLKTRNTRMDTMYAMILLISVMFNKIKTYQPPDEQNTSGISSTGTRARSTRLALHF